MEIVSYLKRLSETNEFLHSFFLLSCFLQILNFVFLCFLLVSGLKFLHFTVPSLFLHYLENRYRISPYGLRCQNCDLNKNSGISEESEEKETRFWRDEDQVLDFITLRKMVKRERKRGDCLKVELEKERRAAEEAAEEAMAMLLKVRMEKSAVEMEAKQYRRVAEEKQVYDQEMIRSLLWRLMKIDDEDKIRS